MQLTLYLFTLILCGNTKTINEAIAFTKQNYQAVAERYPHKLVVITEAGWASTSNGQGIPREHANPLFQKIYYQELSRLV